MRIFRLSEIAVRTGETAAVLDDRARLEVVHAPFLESVVERRRLHLEIFGTSIGEALNAERPDAAVLGELCRCQHELILDASSFGIKASNSCVERGSRRHDRTTHESILHDAMEISRSAFLIWDVLAVRPQRERALHEKERVNGAYERLRTSTADDCRRNDNAAEAVTHEVKVGVFPRDLLQGYQQRVSATFAETACAILHLPE